VQCKYVLNLLLETGMLNSRPVDIPINYHVKLDSDMGELIEDVGQYRWLIGKLIYLPVTGPHITYVVE